MKKVFERPIPLIELPSEQDPIQVGLLIRSARTAPDEDTPGVTWRIRDTLSRRTERRARALRFAVVGLVIFVMGGAVGAVVQPFFRPRAPSSGLPALAPTTGHEHGERRERPRATSAPPASTPPEMQDQAGQAESPSQAAPVATPAPALPVLVARNKPKPAPMRLAARQPVSETEAPPDPPMVTAAVPAAHAAEQALISSVLGKLRVSHEPAAALALLDEYRARFSEGVLAAEATRLRREALLLMGRKATVLAELDRASPSEAVAGDELVLRGELRAAAGRWQAALADFNAVARAHSNGSPGGSEITDPRVRDRLERALWGRASVRSHLGDDDAVCADLGEYLRRFPHGRFATQAKQLLDEECEP